MDIMSLLRTPPPENGLYSSNRPLEGSLARVHTYYAL